MKNMSKSAAFTLAFMGSLIVSSRASAAILMASGAYDFGSIQYSTAMTWNTSGIDGSVIKSLGVRAIFSGPGYFVPVDWFSLPLDPGYLLAISWNKFSPHDRGYHDVTGYHRANDIHGSSKYGSTYDDVYIY